MALYMVSVDTGDGYYMHGQSWFAQMTETQATALSKHLSELVNLKTITTFKIKQTPSPIVAASAIKGHIHTWVAANPKGRNYGGPGSGR